MKRPIRPKTKRNLLRILPFGIIWLVTGLVFIISEKLAIGDNPVLEGAIDPTAKVIMFACLSVFILGLLIGVLEVVLVNRWFKKTSLLWTILLKFFGYTVFFGIMMMVVYPIAASIEMGVGLDDGAVWQRLGIFWGSVAFWSTALQLTFSLLLSLIYAAISEHLGHSVLFNLFTGRYHRPKQEQRIFLFLDMYGSTAIAEALGDIRYFDFLQRYYDDLANAIIAHEGEVYQYIGDEIVITWPVEKGLRRTNCLHCFFGMKQDLERKTASYSNHFGHVPRFKGGMHLGTVTTGEVGALKKEIVFTGDVLNTSARLQGLCKTYKKELLISRALYSEIKEYDTFEFHDLGKVEVEGKREAVGVVAVNNKSI